MEIEWISIETPAGLPPVTDIDGCRKTRGLNDDSILAI
jgi:hypothetical protein